MTKTYGTSKALQKVAKTHRHTALWNWLMGPIILYNVHKVFLLKMNN